MPAIPSVPAPKITVQTNSSLVYRGCVRLNGGWNLDEVVLPLDMVRCVQSPQGVGHIGQIEIFFCPDTTILIRPKLHNGILCLVLTHKFKFGSHEAYYIPIERVVSTKVSTTETNQYQ